MEYVQTIFLGVVQGIAEFLPISSSGHLVILQALLGDIFRGKTESVELNVALHIGTLGSILVVYRKDLLGVLRQPKLCAAIVVATLPVVGVGLFLKDLMDQTLATPLAAGIALCVTGTMMLLTRRVEHAERSLSEMRLRDALIIGLFQAVAPVPGISRSGSTIFGGLLAGMNRDAAARFSFLIAIPAISGAAVLYAKDLIEQGPGDTSPAALAVGTLVAFGVGVVALEWLLRLVTQRRLHWFAWYCYAVGLATISWQLLG
ncbi:Undecaprenyl-diphosphatase [Maioricimonas rarisocia]|uniref:Undecaprenyl-diphosphatase n=1 Tax=Maioricimonas rarisocia TaxID=2528026 RepID=A0A517Z3I1_9PLAN|nr:undecaprenyl-diphosphate phosphatase [Maioricimonas rarisocia]QDU37033.1 Undecaprenyl-diphosphatase [Maioricimonas rarisocia]